MGKPSRTATLTNSLETEERLLAAAMNAFSQHGYHGASIRMIAREAGVTEGLIYHYFDSKEALFARLVDQALAVRALILKDLRPEDSLETNLQRVFAHVTREWQRRLWWRDYFRILFTTLPTISAPRRRALVRKIDDGLQQLARFLEAKSVQGEIRVHDPYQVARSVAGAVLGEMFLSLVLDSEIPQDDSPRAALERVHPKLLALFGATQGAPQ